ncbi:MAG: DarT ssDNA thymidine ADP-ribosyltransferase family protein [Candidatus Methanoperedens sp.]|nr:DarT ssDNA thymidine ADP-ribosyltransferase family protein [Candidatus Methanoperedens sp.]
MDNLGKELLDFLATPHLKEARSEINNLLNVCGNEVSVYYLVPLSNLKNIIADGGIKCRDMICDADNDLSAQYVQEMRDKTLRLAQKVTVNEEIIDKKIHACINFFWNPLNNTSFAFQRNSLLMSEHDNSYGIICIIEMNIRTFFESVGIFWCISPSNLASHGFSSFYKRDYETFDWQ